ncbi:hypothetical protein B0H17DRAFT_1130995 [Mycena rosella]|uniref:Uncharacterized protein n=1 Tax=Mycena rosella TaxID=1033263 RepID=A0AAD7GMK0_MYCRO|nr:hypothetical protein B0H17DRAFT_1130995 [Mycena rosella]
MAVMRTSRLLMALLPPAYFWFPPDIRTIVVPSTYRTSKETSLQYHPSYFDCNLNEYQVVQYCGAPQPLVSWRWTQDMRWSLLATGGSADPYELPLDALGHERQNRGTKPA